MAKRTLPNPPYNSIFLFPLPRSRAEDFTRLFSRLKPDTLAVLHQVTAARNSLLEQINAGDPTNSIQAAKNYMPALFGLIQAAQSLPPNITLAELKISWTSFMGLKYAEKFFTCNHWHYEAVNGLLTYALLCRNKASSLLNSSQAEAQFLETYKEIVQLLSTAAGISDYIREVELARWTQKPVDDLPEKLTEIYTFLSTLCIVEAQQIAIRKAVISQMSFTTIAKLATDVAAKYRYLNDLLNSLGAWAKKFLINNIWFYLSGNALLYDLLVYKLLGYESMATAKIGDALGYFSVGLQRASADLAALPVDKSISATNFRQHIQGQINEVAAVYAGAQKDNNTIYFERVTPQVELAMPPASCIINAIPFVTPEPIRIQLEFEERSGCVVM